MNNVTDYISELKLVLDELPLSKIDEVIRILHEARFENRQIFIMGNGGSASTASHFVCDLAKGTQRPGVPHFRVIGLTDNLAIFSAYANDKGYENVFAGQLENLVNSNDVVIGISASGNSKNVLRAIELANRVGAKTIGFTGFDGGLLKDLVSIDVHIPTNRIGQVEDIHLMLEHLICETLGKFADGSSADYLPLPYPLQVGDATKELADSLFRKKVMPSDPLFIAPTQSSRELLNKISNEFAGKNDLHDMLCRILEVTLESIGAESGTTIVMDEKGEVIDGALSYAGQMIQTKADQLTEIMEHGLAGWVVENRQAALINNTRDDPRWLRRNWEESSDQSRSAISVPLMTKDRVVGVVTLVHPQPGRFTLEDLALLTAIMITISYSVNSKEFVSSKI
jgi:D-sedoheptulose 7-phosphate isomerase